MGALALVAGPIIPEEGGAIELAPYDQPINLYDDTLVALEGFVSRQPRWNLPNGEMQFLTSEGKNLLNTPS